MARPGVGRGGEWGKWGLGEGEDEGAEEAGEAGGEGGAEEAGGEGEAGEDEGVLKKDFCSISSLASPAPHHPAQSCTRSTA